MEWKLKEESVCESTRVREILQVIEEFLRESASRGAAGKGVGLSELRRFIISA